MKPAIFTCVVLSMLAVSAMAVAAPKTPKGPPAKSAILHCGCTEDGLSMAFKQISVSSKAKGHGNHVAGSFDSCSPDGINYSDFVRTNDDCVVSGPLFGGLDACDEGAGQVVGGLCGAASAP